MKTLREAPSVDTFGGKAANLATLLQANLQVPDGFAIGVDDFDKQGQLKAEVSAELEALLDQSKLYAVRSSATVEDAKDTSWAGQFETYLFVEPKDVVNKINECHSAIKARARAYATETGESQDIKVGVVVQEMIDPVYAGVLFTKNPVSGANEVVLEYVEGVGEQLVSGKVTPKELSWDRKKQSLSGAKAPFNAEEVIDAGLRIEKIFDGTPQDVEWAVDKDGKLWITQSRPITTLNIEQVGQGYHYLGDPGDLFYWGPASARTLYMSDFLSSIRTKFKEWDEDVNYPSPPKTLLLFHEDKALWLNKKKAFAEFTEKVFEAYSKNGDLRADFAAWKEAVSEIDPQKTYEPEELLGLLDKAWQLTFNAEFSLYGAEASISKHLEQFDEKERHHIWGAFTLPDEPSFINKIDKGVLELKDPEQLADKYPWALNSYAGVAKRESLLKYFKRRITDLEGNSDVILGTQEQRDEVAKEFGLDTELCRKLDLARGLAQFMDERKAWMMQTRVVIQKMADSFSKAKSLDLAEVERCRLDDLSNGSIEEYFGWTYIDGKNIDLTKADVERSWDWYVEYKAAENVLKGVVSSRGGKHFMTGEVIVIHDPSEQVPDGKIVVVPSTGPSYVPIMRRAAALITDHGGMMSHAAIVAREFNLPCIVGTVHATKLLKNGDKIVLDLVKGEVNR